jgi:DNA-binding CsgD family transcriptional regulator
MPPPTGSRARSPLLTLVPLDPQAALAIGLRQAVDELPAPAYLLDRDRRIQWLNRAGHALLGEKAGEPFCRVIAPEDGTATADAQITLVDRNGRRVRAQLVSAPIEVGGEQVGVFGFAVVVSHAPDVRRRQRTPSGGDSVTPRQLEALRLLAEGLETAEIARAMGVVPHTARNHLRGLFRELGVRSRLHAVIRGYQLGLLDVEDLLGDQSGPT